MRDVDAKLVERLRAKRQVYNGRGTFRDEIINPDGREAADTIERLAQQWRGDRERIARIVEPNAWRERERFLAHLRGENLPGEPGMDEMIKRSAARRVDAVVAPSLAKADAILASLVDDGGVK